MSLTSGHADDHEEGDDLVHHFEEILNSCDGLECVANS